MVNKSENCIFCKIVSREIKSEILDESENFIAIKDINPVSEGHLLVIPKEHFLNLLEIPDKLGNELLKFMKNLGLKIVDKKIGDGFNIIMNNFSSAGQLVMHSHIHLIPRKGDDGIRFLTRK